MKIHDLSLFFIN